MKKEWYQQNDSTWHKEHSWGIRPHRVYMTNSGVMPKCACCGKQLNIYDSAYYCTTNPVRLRKSGYAKMCMPCGQTLMGKFNSPKKFRRIHGRRQDANPPL